MKQEAMSPADLARLTVLYTTPGVEGVTVRRDEPYRMTESGPLTMDVYYPPGGGTGSRLPAVLIVLGYSDAGFSSVFGRQFKELGQTVAWANLIAASGMIAILYSNREPVEDLESVLQYAHDNATTLGIDESRVGLWAASGNVPLALWLLMREQWPRVTCAVLCYGFMLDSNGSTGVAQMQKTFRFANPCAGKAGDDVRSDVPMLIARAGQDQFSGLNESIDNFVAGALRRNLPLTLVNHADGPHAFDLFHDSDTTREIIREILNFLRFHLSGPALSAGSVGPVLSGRP